jgi:cathepsin L
MRFIALLLCIVIVYAAKPKWYSLHTYSFEQYQADFGKTYTEDEVDFRRQIFERKLEEIKAHNNDNTKTWKMGVNQFTDRTQEEFSRRLGVKKSLLYKHHAESLEVVRPDPIEGGVPASVDWRTKGIVTDVKDQGDCGSCWTFATAEVTESYWAMATGKLHVLSEQQILDCTPNPNHCGGTGGCEGGTAELAWARITVMGGLSSEWTYPYVSYYGTDFSCKMNQVTPVAKVSKFINLPPNEQDPMINYIASTGPLAISVAASSWSGYETGIYDGCNQTNPDIDHAVMLVGYGTDAALGDYWLVRNSWNPGWGEDGYIRLKKADTFTCGTDLTPNDGDGCTNGPPTVKVCGTCGILFDGVYPQVST